MTFPSQGDNFRTLPAAEAAPILRDWLAHAASTPTPAQSFNARRGAPIRKDGR